MKRAFISDVHGNLPALEATLADIRAQGVDWIAFLGDAVGYGPQPAECVERIRGSVAVALMGNHDYAAIGSLSMDEFNGYAREAMMVTRSALSDTALSALADFRQIHVDDPYHLVHSSPDDPAAWNYVTSLREAVDQFDHFQTRFCLLGHTHVPMTVIERPGGAYSERPGTTIDLLDDHRYLFNVGSVGQPRDGHPEACYLLVDEEARRAEFRRVGYDIAGTQQAMERLNMPAFLIRRLAVGK